MMRSDIVTLSIGTRVYVSSYETDTLFRKAEYTAGTVWAVRRGRALIRWDNPDYNTSAKFVNVSDLHIGEPPK